MNSAQDYRSQLIARQNTYLKFCFLVSIAGHAGLVAIAAFWFQKPSSDPELVAREPIEYIVIDAPEAEPPLDTRRRANINSAAGGQPIPDLPTNAEQSSRTTLFSSNPVDPGPTPSLLDENTAIRDNPEPNQPSRQASQTSPSPVQSAEQSTPSQAAKPIPESETSPELSRPSSPTSSEILANPTAPPSPTSPPLQTAFDSASKPSTSAADLLPDNGSQALVAQSSNQLFNPSQTAIARGVDAVRDDIWGAYLARLRQSIVGRWGRIQIDQTRQTRVQFTINRQGDLVGSVHLIQSSGFRAADEAALRAVRSAAPFGSFPNGADKTSLTVGFTFNYTLR